MTSPERSVAEAINLCRGFDITTGEHPKELCKLCEPIAKALQEAMREERYRIIKKVNSLDPLEAGCDWDNGDDIAIAVQKFIVKAIRNRSQTR